VVEKKGGGRVNVEMLAAGCYSILR